jgi:hypothetical protein
MASGDDDADTTNYSKSRAPGGARTLSGGRDSSGGAGVCGCSGGACVTVAYDDRSPALPVRGRAASQGVCGCPGGEAAKGPSGLTLEVRLRAMRQRSGSILVLP